MERITSSFSPAIRESMAIEILESRIAPATLIAVDANNNLLIFDSATPETIDQTIAINGLFDGETIVGIDFRPADRQLYALTADADNEGEIYRIDVTTGEAIYISSINVDLEGSRFGVDFNPLVDRLRIVSDSGQNLRVNVDTGAAILDSALNPDTPNVVGSAYSNIGPRNSTTQLFGIDSGTDSLVLQNPPNAGTLTTVGALGVDVTDVAGFDIITQGKKATNTAFAALEVGGVTSLYSINLTTGAATAVNTINAGSTGIIGLAAAPEPITGKSFTFRDVDGDIVTVTTSKGTFDESNFRFDATGTGGSQLQLVDLSDEEFQGAAISISAVRGDLGGDGYVNVGLIDAEGVNLKSVSVDGDLGAILAGDDSTEGNVAIGKLTVQSIGSFGISTQGGIPLSNSEIEGSVSNLTIKSNLFGVQLEIFGDVGKLAIGGSIIGGDAQFSGSITVTGNLKSATIGGSLHGGDNGLTGYLYVGQDLNKLTVKGSLFGEDFLSGSIEVDGDLGTARIGGSLVGNNESSGSVFADSIKSITIDGSLFGDDFESGSVLADAIKTITVKGSLFGGDNRAGTIAGEVIGNVTIGGSVLGGNDFTGILSESTIGLVKIAGDLDSAAIIAQGVETPTNEKAALAIKGITVGGSVAFSRILAGHSVLNLDSGINPDVAIGAVKVGNDWVASNLVVGVESTDGSFGTDTNSLINNGGNADIVAKIASITIGGMAFSDGDGSYGFVAQQIAKFKLGNTTFKLNANELDNLAIGPVSGLRLREYAPEN